MKTLQCLIIDDERGNSDLIAKMLRKHCPAVEVTGFAASANEAYRLILDTQPDLVFLDINMPGHSGFDLLRRFDVINFHVIFITAFSKYAVEAFEFNAVDYLLKPVDHLKLITAVSKAAEKIMQHDYSTIVHFIHSIDEKSQLLKRIQVSHHDKMHVIDLDHICYIQADRGYSEIVLTDGRRFSTSKPLTIYENLLSRFDHFIRANKSMIINVHYIKDYTKGVDCIITTHDNMEIEVSRRKKQNVVQYLKAKITGE